MNSKLFGKYCFNQIDNILDVVLNTVNSFREGNFEYSGRGKIRKSLTLNFDISKVIFSLKNNTLSLKFSASHVEAAFFV